MTLRRQESEFRAARVGKRRRGDSQSASTRANIPPYRLRINVPPLAEARGSDHFETAHRPGMPAPGFLAAFFFSEPNTLRIPLQR
jgi:hypothetical protein